MAGRGGGRTRGLVALLALEAVSQYSRMERRPPVTAGLIAANTLIYLRPSFLDPLLPSIDQVWFNPHLILKYRDLKRFLLSPFYHVGEPHLFYNMVSLLWKGIQLENSSSSSVEFGSTVAVLLVLSQGITLLLAKSLLLLFDYDKPYYHEYAAGFSGVLFAMKVLLSSRSGGHTSVYGVIVPSRYAVWAELLLIQLFVPSVSFLGHLGGILAGVLYLRLSRSLSGPDPLTSLLGGIAQGLAGVIRWPLRAAKELVRWRRGRGITGRGRVGGETREWVRSWACPACTFENNGLLSVCEMCGTPSESATAMSSATPSEQLPLDELRRRRVERFRS